jgi:hypothetical protein
MIANEPVIIIKTTSNKASLVKDLLRTKMMRLQKMFGRSFITHATLKENDPQEKEIILTITGNDFELTHSHKAESIELVVESLFCQIAQYLHKPFVLA